LVELEILKAIGLVLVGDEVAVIQLLASCGCIGSVEGGNQPKFVVSWAHYRTGSMYCLVPGQCIGYESMHEGVDGP